MRCRNCLVLVLSCLMPVVAASEEPPYKRLLTGDDAKQAAELEKQITQQRQAGKYDLAQKAAQQMLELRSRLQGANHWQTADVRRTLQVLTLAAKLPPAAQQELEQTQKLNQEMAQLAAMHQFADALALAGKARDIFRRHLGEENSATAGMFFWTAFLHKEMGQYEKAEPVYREVLARLRRLLGEDHPSTATSCNNLAMNLDELGQHGEAQALLRQALRLRLHVLGEDHPHTAQSCNNLAANLNAQGDLAAAELLFRRALALWQKNSGEDSVNAASGYNNVAFCLNQQCRYTEAEPLYRKSLEMRSRLLGEKHPDTATTLNNLALNLTQQGQYREAEDLYRKSLEICRKVHGEDHPTFAINLNNLAHYWYVQDRFAEAEPLFRQVLAWRKKTLGEEHPETAMSSLNLASTLNCQGKFAEAEQHVREALERFRRTFGQEHPDTCTSQYRLGMLLNAQGKYGEAEEAWTLAASGYEAARLRVHRAGLQRAAFAALHSPLPSLAAVLARQGKTTAAWQRLEENLARGLAGELQARSGRGLSREEWEREQELASTLQRLEARITALLGAPDAARGRPPLLQDLLQQRQEGQSRLVQFAAELARREVYDLRRIQARLSADEALAAWLDSPGQPAASDPRGEHWACVVRRSGEPRWVRLPGSGSNGAWTTDDDRLPRRVRQALAERPQEVEGSSGELLRRLAAQRLAPLEAYCQPTAELPAVRRLVVLSAGTMAGIPVEACTDRYVISYAPSATLWARLREKTTPGPFRSARPHLLALGDPPFKGPDGKALHAELPGTRREVEALARLFPAREVLLGSDASEQRLEQLETEGRLPTFAVLHFATHGELDNRLPLRSALILAQDKRHPSLERVLAGKEPYRGRLTAEHVLQHWKLDADLVVLSGCQTGLGQPAGGEGYLGFSQALFLAGARSLVLSLWMVDDTATTLLMTRFYQNLLGKREGLKAPLAKAEALHEAKQWLRHLTADDVPKHVASLPEVTRGEVVKRKPGGATAARPYEHPYWWSAFILIGDPN